MQNLFWSEQDDERGRGALKQTVFELRRRLGANCIETRVVREAGHAVQRLASAPLPRPRRTHVQGIMRKLRLPLSRFTSKSLSRVKHRGDMLSVTEVDRRGIGNIHGQVAILVQERTKGGNVGRVAIQMAPDSTLPSRLFWAALSGASRNIARSAQAR
jgi:hypothetical protein